MTLKTASQFLCTTHQLRTMHHHKRFGCKRMNCSEDIFWTKPRRQTHKETDTRTWRFWYITPPRISTWGVKNPERGIKQSFMCFKNAMKQQNGMESVVKVWWISEHCADSIFLQHFVGHVEYLRIPDKVRSFYFGRPQKWIQHTQFL